MRSSFLALSIGVVAIASLFGSTAFNYATVGARTVTMTIVQDDSAVIAIGEQDASYACYVNFDTTTGKVSLDFNGGNPDACSGGASGLNPSSVYYFHNILKITNKGQKDWQRLWVNTTDPLVTVNLTFSTDPTMTTGSTYAQQKEFASTVAMADIIYVGVKLDGTTKTKAHTGWTTDLTVAARASP